MAKGGMTKAGRSDRRHDNKGQDGLQVAALPYRRLIDGSLQIMLITSRDTGRWVIPKGWPMKRRTDAQAAAQEAWEEAGLRGRISHEPVGVYGYIKRRKNGQLQQCSVTVFPLLVRGQDEAFPEQGQRDRVWHPQDVAAGLVAEPELADIIDTLDERLLGALPRSRPRIEAPLIDKDGGMMSFRQLAPLPRTAPTRPATAGGGARGAASDPETA